MSEAADSYNVEFRKLCAFLSKTVESFPLERMLELLNFPSRFSKSNSIDKLL